MVSGKTRRWSRRRRTVSGGTAKTSLETRKRCERIARERSSMSTPVTRRGSTPARSSPIKEIRKKEEKKKGGPTDYPQRATQEQSEGRRGIGARARSRARRAVTREREIRISEKKKNKGKKKEREIERERERARGERREKEREKTPDGSLKNGSTG